jgi:hypothetical protein
MPTSEYHIPAERLEDMDRRLAKVAERLERI